MDKDLGKTQREIPSFGEVPATRIVPRELVRMAASYREACRLCWAYRQSKGMTLRTLAERSGLYAPHVTDYLNDDDTNRAGKPRRDLPAQYIQAVESVCGNTAISQWLALQAGLTVLEEVQQAMRAA